MTTTTANAAVVASFFGTRLKNQSSSWSVPTGMTELGDVTVAGSNTTGSRNGSLDYVI